MTIFKSILTFLIFGLYGFLNQELSMSNKIQKSNPAIILKRLQGTWTHSEDSLATVEISKDIWTFVYEGESNRPYNITITNSLPKYVNPKIDSDFLILTSQTDTLEYEIFGISDTVFSLMYFPRGNLHVYKKEKK